MRGMRKTCLLTSAVVLAALTPSGALAAKPAKPTVTITLNPTTVTYGNKTTVSGTLSTGAAGENTTLQSLAFPFSGPFADGPSTPTVAGGNYSYSMLGAQTARLQVSAGSKPGATSPVVNLVVRRRLGLHVGDLTPAKGQRVRFVGVSKPANPGAVISIQRRGLAGWTTITRTTLKAATTTASIYGMRVTIRHSGLYRTVVPGSSGYLGGASPARRLTVH